MRFQNPARDIPPFSPCLSADGVIASVVICLICSLTQRPAGPERALRCGAAGAPHCFTSFLIAVRCCRVPSFAERVIELPCRVSYPFSKRLPLARLPPAGLVAVTTMNALFYAFDFRTLLPHFQFFQLVRPGLGATHYPVSWAVAWLSCPFWFHASPGGSKRLFAAMHLPSRRRRTSAPHYWDDLRLPRAATSDNAWRRCARVGYYHVLALVTVRCVPLPRVVSGGVSPRTGERHMTFSSAACTPHCRALPYAPATHARLYA